MQQFIVHGKWMHNEALYRYFDYLFSYWRWNWVIMLFEAFKITLDSFLDVGMDLGTSFPLGNAPRKSRTIGYKDPVLILFDYHSKFHSGTSVVYPPNGTLRGIF
jgi:hypothetical protein